MNPSRPPAHRPATRRRPVHDLSTIQARMLKKIRARKTPLAQKVALGIALLKAPPELAAEAVEVLTRLCANRSIAPATFAKIAKALTRHESDLPLKVKRGRALAEGTDRWTKLINHYNAIPDGPVEMTPARTT